VQRFVADERDHAGDRKKRLRLALAATYVAAAALGYALGVQGLLPYGALRSSRSSPLSRVGLVLRAESPQADAASWALLRDDVDAVESGLTTPEREVFELVAALRGLRNGGNADLTAAGVSCAALKLVRCDPQALDFLRKRSRP
jgi:hypothetical protein